MGADDYIKNKIITVKDFYDISKYSSNSPFPRDYHPELDNIKLFNDDGFSMYYIFMVILGWCV